MHYVLVLCRSIPEINRLSKNSMEISYWHSRWINNRIGFHSAEVNPELFRYHKQAGIAPGMDVLVPLCGKSVDMKWLADLGCNVTGIEASELPCRAFFEEQELAYTTEKQGAFTLYRSGRITIWHGDFFKFPAARGGNFDAVFDRAALIALPPGMRTRYAGKITELCKPGACVLLISYDYPPGDMAGPPFAVPESEIKTLYTGSMMATRIDKQPVEPLPARFVNRGLTAMHQLTYILRRDK